MPGAFQCVECEAIAKEIFDAVAELRASSKWPEMKWPEISAHRETLLEVLRDDFDEIPDMFRFRATRPGEPAEETNSKVPDALRNALWKMAEHKKRSPPSGAAYLSRSRSGFGLRSPHNACRPTANVPNWL